MENIVALAHYAVNNNLLYQLGPPFAFHLWVAARVLLVHGSTIEKYVSTDIHFLVDAMQYAHQPFCFVLQLNTRI